MASRRAIGDLPHRLLALGALVLAGPAFGGEAADWLARMAESMRETAYEGTLVYIHQDDVESMSVVHGYRDGQEHERLRTLSGQPFEVIRSGEEVTCVWPASRRAMVSQRPGDLLPPKPPRGLASLPEAYRAELGGTGRVAGRSARIIDVRPVDDLRYGYRMWIGRESGLLLRSDLLGTQGRSMERLLFTEVRTLAEVAPERFEPTLEGMEYMLHGDPAAGTESLDDPAWRVTDVPRGFELVARRRQAMPPRGRAVQHSVFSDGLASVSVFIEPPGAGEGDMPLEGLSRMGAVHAFGLKRDGHQVTAVGEVPAETVRRIARAVRRVAD